MKDLAIIITHYKTPHLLMRLLKHLKPASNDIEVIVVDSEAQERTGVLVEHKFPGVAYVSFSENVGYAKLVNTGLQVATRNYILILNADILIDFPNIKRMQAFLKSHPHAGALGVSAAFRFPTIGAILARRTLWSYTPWGKRARAAYEMRDYNKQQARVVDWVRGDCWMLTKQAIEKVGLLDEHFFMYLEDTDWCRRAHQAGLDIYFLPGITLQQHQQGSSRKKSVSGLFYRLSHATSFIKYLLKWACESR